MVYCCEICHYVLPKAKEGRRGLTHSGCFDKAECDCNSIYSLGFTSNWVCDSCNDKDNKCCNKECICNEKDDSDEEDEDEDEEEIDDRIKEKCRCCQKDFPSEDGYIDCGCCSGIVCPDCWNESHLECCFGCEQSACQLCIKNGGSCCEEGCSHYCNKCYENVDMNKYCEREESDKEPESDQEGTDECLFKMDD